MAHEVEHLDIVTWRDGLAAHWVVDVVCDVAFVQTEPVKLGAIGFEFAVELFECGHEDGWFGRAQTRFQFRQTIAGAEQPWRIGRDGGEDDLAQTAVCLGVAQGDG